MPDHRENKHARGPLRYGLDEINDLVTRRWSPMVMRWLLARRLVEARETARLTQSQAARELGWAMSKLTYIEPAERGIERDEDLETAIKVYQPEAADEELWRRLWELSAEPRWWDDRSLGLPLETKRVFGLEWGAYRIWGIVGVVPVYLQTPAYNEAIIRHAKPDESERVINIWRDIGSHRRELVNGPYAATVELLMDESALFRQVGGAEVLAEQLEHLRDVVRNHQHVKLRVIPYTAGWVVGMQTTLVAIGFTESSISPDVVNVDSAPVREVTVFGKDEDLDNYERTFYRLRSAAMDRDCTLQAIDRAMQML